MVNLFRPVQAEQGSLTAALMALLEHSDRNLLNGFLRRANLTAQVPPDGDLRFQFPAPAGPATAGLISAPHFSLSLVTQGPGDETAVPPADTGTVTLLITPTGKGPEGTQSLSWEQVDRWLLAATEQYDADSRTGFLVRQFRAMLPEIGIAYFPGFSSSSLETAPDSLDVLTQFYGEVGRFFGRFGPALSATHPGVNEVRQARPEDLLAGYSYRDYAGELFSPSGFLRIALHLPEGELQVSFWLAPGDAPSGGDPHARLRGALLEDEPLLTSLQGLEQNPFLWLWSAAGEKKLPLADLQPSDITNLDWPQYQVALQRSLPFTALANEGLISQVVELADELLDALAPVLSTVLH